MVRRYSGGNESIAVVACARGISCLDPECFPGAALVITSSDVDYISQ